MTKLLFIVCFAYIGLIAFTGYTIVEPNICIKRHNDGDVLCHRGFLYFWSIKDNRLYPVLDKNKNRVSCICEIKEHKMEVIANDDSSK